MALEEKVTAIIPMRGGSQRVKDKNLTLVGGETLLERKIRILRECSNVKDMIVCSDSDKILEVAKKKNTKTFKMEEKYASSSVVLNDAIRYLLSNVPGEHVMWSQVTSPLIKKETFEETIKTYFDKLKEGYDSLTTYTPIQAYLWNENGPMNYSRDHHVRSQNLPIYKSLNFAMMIIPRELGIKEKYYIGRNPYMVEIKQDEAVDIDNEINLFMSNAFLMRESMNDYFEKKYT